MVALNFEQTVASAFPLVLLSCRAGWCWLWTGQLLLYQLWNFFSRLSKYLVGWLGSILLISLWQ